MVSPAGLSAREERGRFTDGEACDLSECSAGSAGAGLASVLTKTLFICTVFFS